MGICLGGEFGWGGVFVILDCRCFMVGLVRMEIFCGVEGYKFV